MARDTGAEADAWRANTASPRSNLQPSGHGPPLLRAGTGRRRPHSPSNTYLCGTDPDSADIVTMVGSYHGARPRREGLVPIFLPGRNEI